MRAYPLHQRMVIVMKIKWIGKYNGNNLPVVDVGADTKSLPEVTTRSAFMLIPILLMFAFCVHCKRVYLGGIAFSRITWMIGILIALLFFPVHELLHAICFPAGSQVFMFYTMQGLGITCTTPMTRNRFIFVNLFPSIILGGISLILFLVIPCTYAFASTVLCVFSLLHLGGGYADYLNVIHLLKLSKNTIIQISGAKIYWRQCDK